MAGQLLCVHLVPLVMRMTSLNLLQDDFSTMEEWRMVRPSGFSFSQDPQSALVVALEYPLSSSL